MAQERQIVSVPAGTVTRSDDGLTFTASDRSIANFRSFNVLNGETVRFVQPNPSARTLARVVGDGGSITPSDIRGQLRANGLLYLANEAGVIFYGGSIVSAAGFVAAASRIEDNDFLNGMDRFSSVAGSVSVLQNSRIEATAGDIFLVGSQVRIEGEIVATGAVVVATGPEVLVVPRDPNILNNRIQVRVPDGALSSSLGGGIAAGGLGSAAIWHSGTGEVTATEVNYTSLAADSTVTVNGRINASSTTNDGGIIGLYSAGLINVRDERDGGIQSLLDASSSMGVGGSIEVVGQTVFVDYTPLPGGPPPAPEPLLSAEGRDGGGSIVIGGDSGGGQLGPVQVADTVYIGSNAWISASATTAGDGGRVRVNSLFQTEIARLSFDSVASLEAKGGGSGDGGLVDIASGGTVDLRWADVSVARGVSGTADGTLRIQAESITIADRDGFGNVRGDIAFVAAEVLEGSEGNILLLADSDVSMCCLGSLTLDNQRGGERVVFQAGRDVFFGEGTVMNIAGADLWLEAHSRHARGVGTDSEYSSGSIVLGAGVQITLNEDAAFDRSPIARLLGSSIELLEPGDGGPNGRGDPFPLALLTVMGDGAAADEKGLIEIAPSRDNVDFRVGTLPTDQLQVSDLSRFHARRITIGESITSGPLGVPHLVNPIVASAKTLWVHPIEFGAEFGVDIAKLSAAGDVLVGSITVSRNDAMNPLGKLIVSSTAGSIGDLGSDSILWARDVELYAGGSTIGTVSRRLGLHTDSLLVDAEDAAVYLGEYDGLTLRNVTANRFDFLASRTASGAIVQQMDSKIEVTGESSFDAGGNQDITLNETENDFGSAVSLRGRSARIRDKNGITLGDVDLSKNFVVNAGGSIGQADMTKVEVDGTSTFNTGRVFDVTLNETDNDFGGAVSLSGGAAAINDINDLLLGTVGVAGLTATATGSITQSGIATITGISSFTAGTAITLTNAGNDFGGAVSLSGGAAAINDINDLLLGTVGVAGLTATATGSITQSGIATITGISSFTAGTAITLTNAGNDFGGAVSLSGRNARIRDVDGIRFGRVDLAGAFGVRAGGHIEQDGSGMTVAGFSRIRALDGDNLFDVTLDNSPLNNFNRLKAIGLNLRFKDEDEIRIVGTTASQAGLTGGRGVAAGDADFLRGSIDLTADRIFLNADVLASERVVFRGAVEIDGEVNITGGISEMGPQIGVFFSSTIDGAEAGQDSLTVRYNNPHGRRLTPTFNGEQLVGGAPIVLAGSLGRAVPFATLDIGSGFNPEPGSALPYVPAASVLFASISNVEQYLIDGFLQASDVLLPESSDLPSFIIASERHFTSLDQRVVVVGNLEIRGASDQSTGATKVQLADLYVTGNATIRAQEVEFLVRHPGTEFAGFTPLPNANDHAAFVETKQDLGTDIIAGGALKFNPGKALPRFVFNVTSLNGRTIERTRSFSVEPGGPPTGDFESGLVDSLLLVQGGGSPLALNAEAGIVVYFSDKFNAQGILLPSEELSRSLDALQGRGMSFDAGVTSLSQLTGPDQPESEIAFVPAFLDEERFDFDEAELDDATRRALVELGISPFEPHSKRERFYAREVSVILIENPETMLVDDTSSLSSRTASRASLVDVRRFSSRRLNLAIAEFLQYSSSSSINTARASLLAALKDFQNSNKELAKVPGGALRDFIFDEFAASNPELAGPLSARLVEMNALIGRISQLGLTDFEQRSSAMRAIINATLPPNHDDVNADLFMHLLGISPAESLSAFPSVEQIDIQANETPVRSDRGGV